MKMRYDLEEGKCMRKCILRKWKFCRKIKDIADGKVSRTLLEMSPGTNTEKLNYETNIKKMRH